MFYTHLHTAGVFYHHQFSLCFPCTIQNNAQSPHLPEDSIFNDPRIQGISSVFGGEPAFCMETTPGLCQKPGSKLPGLLGAWAQELHPPGLQIIDTSLDLHFTRGHLLLRLLSLRAA